MKVAVFGAGGIVGQTMRLCVPDGINVRFYRKASSHVWGSMFYGVDLTDRDDLAQALKAFEPDVIVNLAGENRPDVVAQDASAHYNINVFLPILLARYCDRIGAHYVHVSSQAVFSGLEPPYDWPSPTGPANAYGLQKEAAERWVAKFRNWTIARLTFVLGIRPLQGTGRKNPLEEMLSNPDQRQVNDRWFSPLFARDAAAILWELVQEKPAHRIVHLGTPERVTRYQLAGLAAGLLGAGHQVTAVPNDAFPGIAARPIDTTWAAGSLFRLQVIDGLAAAVKEWIGMETQDLASRARELALYLGINGAAAAERLSHGFGALHNAVAEDFRRANPTTDQELLNWYRLTMAYLWELSAYHLDAGFNHMAMCQGIANHLRYREKPHVLCLGDGIGDLTLTLAEAGLDPVYNDLAGSQTAGFAKFRLTERLGFEPKTCLTEGWVPRLGRGYDAVVALDFFEHVPNVEEWVREVYEALKPGGTLLAQNAFGIGSGEHGSIPSHLAVNDRFERDWDPLLDAIGFLRDVDETGTATGWRRKP